MEPQRWPFRLPCCRRARLGGIEREHQALVATPGGAEAEQLEPIDHRRDGLLRARLEHNPEQSAGAQEIALPELVLRVARQGRVEHACDLGPLLQPARYLDAGAPMPFEPHLERADAAQAKEHLLGAGTDAETSGLRD